jgi:DNA-binding response OmpR family regulator
MTTKRLLFIQDDQFLGTIYRDSLEAAGFAVETARDEKTALKILAEMRPDAVVLDPLLSHGSVEDTVRKVKTLRSSSSMPIMVLPTPHHALVTMAERAGATHVLARTANPLSSLLGELQKALGMLVPRDGFAVAPLDSYWKQATLDAAPASILALQQAHREVLRDHQNHAAWRDLLTKAHAFAGQVTLLGDNAVAHLALALETTIYGLISLPERITPSVLQTMGQSLDFIVRLWQKGMQKTPLNLNEFHVVIVEDDPRAREMIGAAMDMVGISSDGLETPNACVAILSSQPCDLIFMDINLPEMNGFEACTQIRTLPLHERTPIVFLTGMTSFQNKVQSSLSGGNDFVGKPFNLAELGLKGLIWLFKGRFGLN